jgi:ADP-ribosylglycohydrolase
VKAKKDKITNFALGAIVGLALGDIIGGPIEFVSAFEDKIGIVSEHDGLIYKILHNKFNLFPGQWTDDTSMALCLMDSLLCHPDYNGSDLRFRFALWWHRHYNNAFRFEPHDTKNKHMSSVGLGGNIAESFGEIDFNEILKMSEIPPTTLRKSNDAGNGSIMRLAPVPIKYYDNMDKALKVAELQSKATHGGDLASECCKFMTYFMVNCINRTIQTDIKTFIDTQIEQYLKKYKKNIKKDLLNVLQSNASSDKELCWNWKTDNMKQLVRKTIKNRGYEYNGYPVSAEYFGSFCLDALSMALWGLYNSTSVDTAILPVVLLYGDADSTGAVVGQMAGAFYGYDAIVYNTTLLETFINMHQWDPFYEIELRTLFLLNRLDENDENDKN